MKHTVLKKSAALLLTLLCLVAVLVFPAAAEETRVYDPSGMLTEAEASSLAARMDELSTEYGVEFYFATYVAENRYDDFYGDDYCTRVQNLNGTDAVLLVVTYEEFNRTYYYNMYTYADANYDINQKEASEKVTDDLFKKGVTDPGNAYAYAIEAGLSKENATAVAISITSATRDELKRRLIDGLFKRTLSAESAVALAKLYGFEGKELEELQGMFEWYKVNHTEIPKDFLDYLTTLSSYFNPATKTKD